MTTRDVTVESRADSNARECIRAGVLPGLQIQRRPSDEDLDEEGQRVAERLGEALYGDGDAAPEAGSPRWPSEAERSRRVAAGVPERFVSLADPDPDSGCWRWVGAIEKTGYGRVTVARRAQMAHRAVYEAVRGPIPRGRHIDHLCRNRACVNPAHLEAVTQRENNRRGDSPSWRAHRTGICQRGHAFRPGRDCQVCALERKRAYRARRRAREAGAA